MHTLLKRVLKVSIHYLPLFLLNALLKHCVMTPITSKLFNGGQHPTKYSIPGLHSLPLKKVCFVMDDIEES